MYKRIIFSLIMAGTISFSFAEKKKSSGKKNQYKKQNRDRISEIVLDKEKKVEEYFLKYLKKSPDDLESMYGLVLSYTKQDKLKEAVKYMQLSLEKGIDFSRYIAGPRNMLTALYETKEYKAAYVAYTKPVIHGPLIGSTGSDFTSVWMRTDKEREVTLQVSDKQDFSSIVTEAKGTSSQTDDYTLVIKAKGLNASTQYFYRLLVDGKVQESRGEQKVKTFPAKGEKTKFSIVFGGGAGYTPQYERMWDTLRSHNPTAMLLLGDNIYIDTPEIQETQKYCYYRRQSRPEYNAYVAQTPIFAIYDDHDFGDNDCYGTPNKDFPAWKRPVLKTFQDNWANPSYGGGQENPGAWFSFNIGDVDFFFMDCRYYRDKQLEQKSGKTMLGAYQKAWLKDQLKNSKAKFKVLCSTVPMAYETKPGEAGFDTWDGYKGEREEIFNFLAEENIEGLFIASADRHRSDAWLVNRPKGYALHEFMSSRLTNIHTHPVQKRSLFGYSEKCSFGKLNFDLTKDDPTVTYEIFNIDNKKIHDLTLKLSQLKGKK
jgi:alkaline phosphatase D